MGLYVVEDGGQTMLEEKAGLLEDLDSVIFI